ncbi:hypothetical protein Glove_315g67 [Diversispora epigaea]|uniref:CTLH domain-containing protein n=1 Tax=Diversispora epigaea TaxID=1348612 RepID=A0A397HQK7_9GLOM|nr:hypothetical protein Glove_315g67 [Diversispora epigaea]
MAYHHILRQIPLLILLSHLSQFKSLQNAVKFISTNNSKASDLALAQDHRDLLIRFMRVRGNFNLRGAIEWIREQISKGNYGDYSLLSIPLAITQSSTATNQAHGYNKQEIAIDARFFASNEILALGFISIELVCF